MIVCTKEQAIMMKVMVSKNGYLTFFIVDIGSGSHVHDYLASLIAWTKIIPQFESLKRDDQVYLVQSAWNEITIADIAHKSIDYEVRKLLKIAEFLSRLIVHGF